MSNQAAWIKEKNARLVVDDAEKGVPGPGEVLVKVDVIGFSPIESKIQRFGTHPIPYPNILGTSFSGTVEAVGPDVTALSVGDHIGTIRAGKTLADPRFGAFQKYALASVASSAKLLPGTSLEGAATTMINLAAITSALSIHLELERPPLTGTAEPKGKKILVYGGTSSCGGLAIRYAVTAGYTVVTTSSPKHRDWVSSLGPSYIIDHTLPADAIAEELRRQGPYDKILDTIGLPPVTNLLVPYIESLPGGGSYNTLIPLIGGEIPIPDNVKRLFAAYNWAFEEPQHKEIARWFYEEYIPRGLESGLIVPTRPQVVEGGLAQVQHALDLMDQGAVSGHKLVMDPWKE